MKYEFLVPQHILVFKDMNIDNTHVVHSRAEWFASLSYSGDAHILG